MTSPIQAASTQMNALLKRCNSEKETAYVDDYQEIDGSLRFYLNRDLTKTEWENLTDKIPVGAEKKEQVLKQVVGTSTQRRKRVWIEYSAEMLSKPIQIVSNRFKMAFIGMAFFWVFASTLYWSSQNAYATA